jgi:hypothetical protein
MGNYDQGCCRMANWLQHWAARGARFKNVVRPVLPASRPTNEWSERWLRTRSEERQQ